MKILITGVAGFIGYHTAKKLLSEGFKVCGVDSLNSTIYEASLKEARLEELLRLGLEFKKIDISDRSSAAIFSSMNPDIFLHLAAQAGVRYALENPRAYVESNLCGFFEVLEWIRQHPRVPLIYASSSSVYGNTTTSCSEDLKAMEPESFYAATKRSNELMAYSYHKTFGIKVRGMRFFTVYGPFGRPDMAYFSFTKAFLAGEPLTVFHEGRSLRDYTYVDDIVEGICKVMKDDTGFEIYNLGHSHPQKTMELIGCIESYFGKKAPISFVEGPKGDVDNTFACIEHAQKQLGFNPKITLREGMHRFLDWYVEYYGVDMQTF